MLSLPLMSLAEITIGIVVSCVPNLPKFFDYFGPRISRNLFPWAKVSSLFERNRKPIEVQGTRESEICNHGSRSEDMDLEFVGKEARGQKEEPQKLLRNDAEHRISACDEDNERRPASELSGI